MPEPTKRPDAAQRVESVGTPIPRDLGASIVDDYAHDLRKLAKADAAQRESDAAPGDERVLTWTCPHGVTYSGHMDFISGARNAHDELAGLETRLRDVAAAWFEFRQSDLDVLLHDYREDGENGD